MSETAQAEKDRRHARIDALTDWQRRDLLAYLCGYAPKGVDTWLDELESDDGPPSV
jgi:hypothetical protein